MYKIIFWVLRRREMESKFLRFLFKKKYDLEVGMYSYGCFDPNRFFKNTVIGRYCSISTSAVAYRRNHPLGSASLHPYFYNTKYKFRGAKDIPFSPLIIEDGVWIGANVIITPKVKRIGRGSVIGAGSVVTKDVGRYTIVGGNPATVLRKRFSQDVAEEIEETKWWLLNKRNLEELSNKKNSLFFLDKEKEQNDNKENLSALA